MNYFALFIIPFALSFAQLIINQIDDDESLLINIKNDGGEVYQEVFSANSTQDTIEMQFKYTDGSHFTHLIDFKSV